MRIFVYGSLKPGGWSHDLLEGFVDEGMDAFISADMYDVNGRFPAIRLRNDEDFNVKGVLYNVLPHVNSDLLLRNLDRLEGYPDLYDRTEVKVWPSGSACYTTAMVYFGVNERLFNGRLIESGEWLV